MQTCWFCLFIKPESSVDNAPGIVDLRDKTLTFSFFISSNSMDLICSFLSWYIYTCIFFFFSCYIFSLIEGFWKLALRIKDSILLFFFFFLSIFSIWECPYVCNQMHLGIPVWLQAGLETFWLTSRKGLLKDMKGKIWLFSSYCVQTLYSCSNFVCVCVSVHVKEIQTEPIFRAPMCNNPIPMATL